jgi:hypothetical protein
LPRTGRYREHHTRRRHRTYRRKEQQRGQSAKRIPRPAWTQNPCHAKSHRKLRAFRTLNDRRHPPVTLHEKIAGDGRFLLIRRLGNPTRAAPLARKGFGRGPGKFRAICGSCSRKAGATGSIGFSSWRPLPMRLQASEIHPSRACLRAERRTGRKTHCAGRRQRRLSSWSACDAVSVRYQKALKTPRKLLPKRRGHADTRICA